MWHSPCESRAHCTPVWYRQVITNGNFLILIQAIVTYLIIIITSPIISAARSTRDTISNVISGAWWHKYFAIFLHKFVACSATFNLTVHATFCLAIYQKIAKILFFMKKKVAGRQSKQLQGYHYESFHGLRIYLMLKKPIIAYHT